jgi:hypothetical protein
MSIRETGCCGAYCKTCRESVAGSQCRRCKLGYENGERDISRSRCPIKNCCFRDKHLETCADCDSFMHCEIIQGFYAKKGYKYGRYRQALEFIRQNGYPAFLKVADEWKGPYCRL